MALGSDRVNSGNYLLRDVTRAQAFVTPEQRESALGQRFADSSMLRATTCPAGPGDVSPNHSIFAMKLPDTQNPAARQMLNGCTISGQSMDNVGVSGSRWAHNLTNLTGNEWGGLIYKDQEGNFHATPPVTDELRDNVDPDHAASLVPVWSKDHVVADYHSHTQPRTAAHYEFDNPSTDFQEGQGWKLSPGQFQAVLPENPLGTKFSAVDKQAANYQNHPAYMADPEGHVRKYDPPPKPASDDLYGPDEGRSQILE